MLNELKNKYTCLGRTSSQEGGKVSLGEKKRKMVHLPMRDCTYIRQVLFLENRKRGKSGGLCAA